MLGEPVGFVQIAPPTHVLNVRPHTRVRNRHALGLTCGARCEQQIRDRLTGDSGFQDGALALGDVS